MARKTEQQNLAQSQLLFFYLLILLHWCPFCSALFHNFRRHGKTVISHSPHCKSWGWTQSPLGVTVFQAQKREDYFFSLQWGRMGKCSLETINKKEELLLNSFPLELGSLKLCFASSWQNQIITLAEAQHEHKCSASNQHSQLLAQAPHSLSPWHYSSSV